jgi:hypothetical protein
MIDFDGFEFEIVFWGEGLNKMKGEKEKDTEDFK